MKERYDVIVIGGGASGLMAAVAAAGEGCRVLIAEKMEKCGRKIRITGKGRCNITNITDTETFLGKVRSGAEFVRKAIETLPPERLRQMLEKAGMDIKGQTIAISGFGNVAWGAATKATELGAKVVTISGPDGYIYDPEGLNAEKIAYMLELRASNNDVVAPYADKFPGSKFVAGRKPWEVKVDIAMPCATQNELGGEDAKQLLANGVKIVAEVSNMGCRPEAIDAFIAAKIPYGPGKAVNAGGVATSALEMAQSSGRLFWTFEEVDKKLKSIMISIYHNIDSAANEYGCKGNYVLGANIAGFLKVAEAMMAQGIV